MQIRPYTPLNYPIIKAWWTSHQWSPVAEHLLPNTGFMAWDGLRPIASVFLYLTNSKFVLMEWVLADPKSDKIDRDEALDLLIDHCALYCKNNGYGSIFTTSDHPKLIERLNKHNFITGDTNVTLLTRVL